MLDVLGLVHYIVLYFTLSFIIIFILRKEDNLMDEVTNKKIDYEKKEIYRNMEIKIGDPIRMEINYTL